MGSIHLYVHNRLYLNWFVCLSTCRYGVTCEVGCLKHDIHIKPKSYKLELLGKLVIK